MVDVGRYAREDRFAILAISVDAGGRDGDCVSGKGIGRGRTGTPVSGRGWDLRGFPTYVLADGGEIPKP